MNESDINRVGSHISDARFKRLSAFIEKEIGIKMPETKRSMIESRLQKTPKGAPHEEPLTRHIDKASLSGNGC
ncbi:hypothetical protein MASR2M48_27380 [Spirochaetota bacterium]